jgi:broad specificity phosphatase PhoE
VLLLVRHCESTGNADGLLLGRTDSPLSEHGERQGAGLKRIVDREGPVARVISSPLTRARRTAEALGLGLPIEVDERWTEVDYGRFEGEKLTALPAEVWRNWRTDPDFRPPGGESLADLGTRVRDACEELFATEGAGARASEHVVVVSHVSPIKAAVGWALGTGDEVAWRMWLATASLSVIGWGTGSPSLRRYNLVSSEDPSEKI